VHVLEDIGLLRKVSLTAAAWSEWTGQGGIMVDKDALPDSGDYAFPFALGTLVVSSGIITLDATQVETVAVQDMSMWWGDISATTEALPAHTAADWSQLVTEYEVVHTLDAQVHVTPGEIVHYQGAGADAVADCSLANQEYCSYCTNREDGGPTVEHGWSGQGHEANYCNLCTCTGTTFECTQRVCGEPAFTDTSDWSVCPEEEVECRWSPEEAENEGEGLRIKVLHHTNHTTTKRHVCTYNDFTEDCVCKCQNAPTEYGTEPQRGTHAFDADRMNANSAHDNCETVHLNHAYDPESGDVNVIVSASFEVSSGLSVYQNNPGFVWVKDTQDDSFVVCARLGGITVDAFAVDYYVHQNEPWTDATASRTPIEGLNAAHKVCQTISYGMAYATPPKIVGSVDFDGAPIQQRPNSWLENIGTTEFRVCFYNEAQLSAADTVKPNFNWIAFPHSDPHNFFPEGAKPYSWAGRASNSAGWTQYGVTSQGAEGVSMNLFKSCETVEYGHIFTTTPTVIVTANHEDSVDPDWSAEPHASTQTWVQSVSSSDFVVCSSQRTVEEDRDNTLTWDWIAFAEDSAVVRCEDGIAVAAP
jgi:hypothetical protein